VWRAARFYREGHHTSGLLLIVHLMTRLGRPPAERPVRTLKGARNLVLRITANGAKTWTFLYANATSPSLASAFCVIQRFAG